MELRGSAEDFDKGISYLEQKTGVQVEPVTLGIRRDEERCCQCGSCTAVCPTGALKVKRYRKFYGLPENRELLEERLLEEAVHELGHTVGLFHCHDPACVMKSSTYVEEIDFKSSRFCDKCLDK